MKAQVSTEFILYAAILVFILAFAAYFAVVTAGDIRTEGVNTDAKRVAAIIATEINTAVEVGDGYSRRFFLPQTLYSDTNYTVSIDAQRVYVLWNSRSYSLPVLAGNTTGVPAKGYNTLKNVNGVIIFV